MKSKIKVTGMRASLSLLAIPLVLTGCGFSTIPPASLQTGVAIQGKVHGGQQPIVNAHIYLMGAATTGYGTASNSLLTTGAGTDTIGIYVTSDSTGSFTVTNDYKCTPGTQVYLYALGGDPGSGANSASGLLAILGDCPSSDNFLATTPDILVNEVSTIAAAYAFAGYAADATHISSSGTTLAIQGIKNAFANAANLENLSTGAALATTPNSNTGNVGTIPQAEIYSLANVLAACVNSTGPTSSECNTLLGNAVNGTTVPKDTATAAINIAHNPGANVAALYGLQGSTPPFANALTSMPNDWTISVSFTAGGFTGNTGIAVDGSGNVWVEGGLDTVTELSPAGVALSGSQGFSTPGSTTLIAIDSNGYVWVTGGAGNDVAELSSSGTLYSGSNGYPAGPGAFGVAIDLLGNVWVADLSSPSVTELLSTGATRATYTGGGLNNASGIAFDENGNAWIANRLGGSITKISGSGTVTSSTLDSQSGPYGIAIDSGQNVWISNFYGNSLTELNNGATTVATYTGGGLSGPGIPAIDGLGNIWVANGSAGSSISEFSNLGVALSPSTGFVNAGLAGAQVLAIDGSGNVWVSNLFHGQVFEFIGAASPVVTPLVTALGSGRLGALP
jgi:streptogramin lyase